MLGALENPVPLLLIYNVSDTRNRTIAAEKYTFLNAFQAPDKTIKKDSILSIFRSSVLSFISLKISSQLFIILHFITER